MRNNWLLFILLYNFILNVFKIPIFFIVIFRKRFIRLYNFPYPVKLFCNLRPVHSKQRCTERSALLQFRYFKNNVKGACYNFKPQPIPGTAAADFSIL